jgi:hypothetical protein
LDEVDWEEAADAFIRSARNMTLSEIKAKAEMGAARLEANGEAGAAEAFRRVVAVLNRRLAN